MLKKRAWHNLSLVAFSKEKHMLYRLLEKITESIDGFALSD